MKKSTVERNVCRCCGENGPFKLIYKRYFNVIECTCGFLFVDNLVSETHPNDVVDDEGTVQIHHKYEDVLSSNAKNRFHKLRKVITVRKSQRLLDVGYGNGYFLKIAKDFGMDVAGIELNAAAARYAKARFGVPVYLYSPPYKEILSDELFDIVTLWGVIEHIPYPSRVIQSLGQLMHVDSWLVIQTPSQDALIRKLVHLYNKLVHSEFLVDSLYTNRLGGHIQCFSRKSMNLFLSGVGGFSIEQINDSTYGLGYLLKKPAFQGKSLKQVILKALAILGYRLSFLIGHQNHMTVYATKS